MKASKKTRLDLIISEIESGKNPAKISADHDINKKTLQDYLRELKKLGIIEKKGYGVWEVNQARKRSLNLTNTHSNKKAQTSPQTSPQKEIRGHAFIWKIEFVDPIDWGKSINRYSKKKLTFQLMKHNKILRTIFKGRKIWLGVKGLTIYEPIDFMGKSSFEVKGKAVFEMDLIIRDLLRELGVKFRPYRFTTSREHYGIIKNELARQHNDRKEKMLIRSEDGTLWMWIDDSKGLGELENEKPNINRQVQNFWNNHKKHEFGVDADFVLKGMAKLTAAQVEGSRQLAKYEEQNKEHLALIQEYREESRGNTKLIQALLKKLEGSK